MKEINTKELIILQRKIQEYKKALNKFEDRLPNPIRIKSVDEIIALNEKFNNKAKKLETEIKSIEGKASVRCINSEGIAVSLIDIENKLGISKKALEGVEVLVNIHAQTFPHSYTYPPMSTHFKAIMKNGAWRITDIQRKRCNSTTVIVNHTESSRYALIAKYERW